MQIDSHHRFVEGWDAKCIEMIHSTDAGEYSVLTGYPGAYTLTNPERIDSEAVILQGKGTWNQIFIDKFNATGWYES